MIMKEMLVAVTQLIIQELLQYVTNVPEGPLNLHLTRDYDFEHGHETCSLAHDISSHFVSLFCEIQMYFRIVRVFTGI